MMAVSTTSEYFLRFSLNGSVKTLSQHKLDFITAKLCFITAKISDHSLQVEIKPDSKSKRLICACKTFALCGQMIANNLVLRDCHDNKYLLLDLTCSSVGLLEVICRVLIFHLCPKGFLRMQVSI